MQLVEIRGIVVPDFTTHLRAARDVIVKYAVVIRERWQKLAHEFQKFIVDLQVFKPSLPENKNLPLWRQTECRIEIRKLSPTARRFRRNIWRWIRGNLWSGERKREA